MTHTNGFPTHPPEPRERAAPVRVLVVELRDGNVVDTTEPTETEVIQWLKDRGYEVGLTRRIPDPVVARELEFGAVIPDQLGQPAPTFAPGGPTIPGMRLDVVAPTNHEGIAAAVAEVLVAAGHDAKQNGGAVDVNFGQPGNPARDARLRHADESANLAAGPSAALWGSGTSDRLILTGNKPNEIQFGTVPTENVRLTVQPGLAKNVEVTPEQAAELVARSQSSPAVDEDEEEHTEGAERAKGFAGLDHLAGRLGVAPGAAPGQWVVPSSSGRCYDPVAILAKIMDRCDELAEGLFDNQSRIGEIDRRTVGLLK